MANKIIVERGGCKAIAELLGCSHMTVTSALNGLDSTEIRKRVREVALERFHGYEVIKA